MSRSHPNLESMANLAKLLLIFVGIVTLISSSGCSFDVLQLVATKTTTESVSMEGGDKLPIDGKIQLAQTLDLCGGVRQQILVIEASTSRSKSDMALLSTLVTGIGGLVASVAQIFRADLGETASDIGTGSGLLATGIGIVGGFVISIQGSDAELDLLRATVPTIDAQRAAYNDAVREGDEEQIRSSLAVLRTTCDRASDSLARYNGDEELANAFDARARLGLFDDIRKKFDEQATRAGLSILDAQRDLQSLATGQGYGKIHILYSWIVGPGGVLKWQLPVTDLSESLLRRRSELPPGNILLGLWARGGDSPTPGYRLVPEVTSNASIRPLPSVPGTELTASLYRMPGFPLFAPALEYTEMFGPFLSSPRLSNLGIILALAPYGRNLDPRLNEFLCGRFPVPFPALGAPPGDGGTVAVELKAPGCKSILMTVVPDPSLESATFNYLRRAGGLPDASEGSWGVNDLLTITAAPLSQRQTPGPALAVILWAEGSPE